MTVSLRLNGEPISLEAAADTPAITILRDLGLTGVKHGCDSQTCGACTIRVDEKAARACALTLADLDSRQVQTIEGLAQDGELDALQSSFINFGATQCGFCTPGMLMTVAAARDEGRLRSRQDIRRAIGHNLCRCTGYQKIIDAVEAAVESSAPAATVRVSRLEGHVGARVPNVRSRGHVTGTAKYTADYPMAGVLHAAILSSPHPHARIVAIDPRPALALPGVRAVLTHKDVPRVMQTSAGQHWPEPSPQDACLLDAKVRFVGDRVAVVAAENPDAASAACAAIGVQYEVLPFVLSAQEAVRDGASIIHDEVDALGIYDATRNMAAHVRKSRGDIEAGMREAELVLERTYETQRVQHCSMEPHVALAWTDSDGRLCIRTSSQVAYHVRRQVARLLQLPIHSVNVVVPEVGGGFGGKQEVFIEPLVGALALRTRRPVLLEYSRRQEFTMARTRHPATIKLKAGLRRDGRLTAVQMLVLADTGAYGSHAATVLGNTGSKTLALYRIPNLLFEASVAYTNTVPAGAFRGYGCPQGFFALESLLDEAATELGISPVDIRLANSVRVGDRDELTFQGELGHPGILRVIRSGGLKPVLDALPHRSVDHSSSRGMQSAGVRYGRGIACAMQGSGVATISRGSAQVSVNEDGTFLLRAGPSDIGTGSDTVLAQLAAQALDIDVSSVRVVPNDTDSGVFFMGAYASGTTIVLGNAVIRACRKLTRDILRMAALVVGTSARDLTLRGRFVVRRTDGAAVLGLAEVGAMSFYDRGQPLVARGYYVLPESPPPFVAVMVDIEVNPSTGSIVPKVLRAAVDLGRAINPLTAEGQIEGALVQGLGFALHEHLVINKSGSVSNPSFAEYHVPTALDVPEMEVTLIETNDPVGPFGAKSVAEVALSAVAPAVANAVYDATGVRLRSLPISKTALLDAFRLSAFPQRSAP